MKNKLTDIDINESIEDICKKYQKLGFPYDEKLCKEYLQSSNGLPTTERIKFVKYVIAYFPDSYQIIKKIIFTHDLYEIRFSLFCYLEELFYSPYFEKYAKEKNFLAKDMEKYLITAKSNAGYALWMACDMIGDHFPIGKAFEILTNSLMKAKYAIAREQIVNGIEKLLQRVKENSEVYREYYEKIYFLLEKVIKIDRSKYVKTSAFNILTKYKKI